MVSHFKMPQALAAPCSLALRADVVWVSRGAVPVSHHGRTGQSRGNAAGAMRGLHVVTASGSLGGVDARCRRRLLLL